jgi:spermidine/putrescine transport system ATP-binding protein
VRPEKMRIQRMDAPFPAAANQLVGTVVDASFTGVSTEYLVDTPGVGLVGTFSQNLGQDPASPGDKVRLLWEPDYSFGLPGDEDTSAGGVRP